MMKQLFSAGVIPYRQVDNKIEFLLVRHAHGHWEFPKGTIDPGETVQEAALRELYEEAGVTARLQDGFYENITYVFFDQKTKEPLNKQISFFLGEVIDGQVTISAEHIDAQWLSWEQAYECLTHQESRMLLEKAARHLGLSV